MDIKQSHLDKENSIYTVKTTNCDNSELPTNTKSRDRYFLIFCVLSTFLITMAISSQLFG